MNENKVTVVINGSDQSGPALQAALERIKGLEQPLGDVGRAGAGAMQSVSRETQEAKAAFLSLGEEIGVRVPRHLATALASFKSVRDMASSIALGAELGLGIAVFDTLQEKVKSIAGDLAGWGEEQQAVYKEEVSVNNQLLDLANKRKELERQIVLDRLDGSAKIQKAEEFALEDVKDKAAEIEKIQKEIAAQQAILDQPSSGGHVEMRGRTAVKVDVTGPDQDQRKAAQDAITGLTDKLALLQKELDNQKLSVDDLGVHYQKAFGEEATKAAKDFLDMRLQMWADEKQHDDDVIKSAKIEAAAVESQVQYLSNVMQTASAAVKGPFDDMETLGQTIRAMLADVAEKTQEVTTAEQNYTISVVEGDRKINAIRDQARAKLEGLTADYKALATASGNQIAIKNADDLEKKLDELKVVMDSLRKETVQQLTGDVQDFFKGFLDGSKTGAAAFVDFGKAILSTLAQIEARMIAVWTIEKLTGLFTSFAGGGVSGTLGEGNDEAAFFGDVGHAAGGGGFSAGDWSWVGEEGPELVKFGSSATVIPHSASVSMASGGGGDTYYQDFRGADAGMLQQVQNMIRVSEERSVARAKIEFLDMQRRRA